MTCMSIKLEDYDNNNVFFSEPVENTVIENSKYIKLIFSDSEIVMNGITIFFDINVLSTDKQFSRKIFNFNYSDNSNWIETIKVIDKMILDKYNTKKKKVFKIAELLYYGKLRIFSENDKISNKFLLVISGLWEDQNSYGLTFKFRNV